MLAQEEARILGHSYIGTEHILLGLLREGDGVAGRALVGLGIDLDRVRAAVMAHVGQTEGTVEGHVPFTPRAKKVLEISLREALQLGHNYIGTEHILLGLIREGEGVAAQVLTAEFRIEPETVRNAVLDLMSGYSAAPVERREEPARNPPLCPLCMGDLEGHLGTRSLSASRDEEGGVDPIVVVYCRTCGRSLGVVSGPSLA